MNETPTAHRLEGVGVFSPVHLGETGCPAESSSLAGLRSPETSASRERTSLTKRNMKECSDADRGV